MPKLTEEQKARLQALEEMPDEEIDYSAPKIRWGPRGCNAKVRTLDKPYPENESPEMTTPHP